MDRSKRKFTACLIWLCWLVYACSYIGKLNYAANINQVMAFYQVDHAQAGLVSTLFFFAYGIGQFVNGAFCKKYNLKYVVFCSLAVSATINLAVGLSTNFALIQILWLVNGFSMSILWPSMVRLLSETVDGQEMPKVSVIMGTTVAVGTLFVYAVSALFVKWDFKLSFYLPALIMFALAFVWLLSVSKLVSGAKAECQELQTQNEAVDEKQDKKYDKLTLLFTVVILAFYGVATNLIKDGLTTWVPSILKEQYHLDGSISIVLTLALPIVGIFANAFAIKLHKKIPDYVFLCAVMFIVSGAIIGGVIAGISLNQFIITLIGFTAVCFLATACNSVITSIFPLLMKGKVNSGMIAGVLNGFCYLGSTVSAYGLGAVADNFGWTSVFWVLLAVCALVFAVALVYSIVKKLKKQDK